MTLDERARAVRTREDLIAFLECLSADYAANGATWDNADLASFLVAMAAWAADMDGWYNNHGEELATVAPWRVLADILMAARVYE